ncbi:MAG TPA: helix-turn-helix domain-containing protein [Micromonosporaceae bacterium]
MPSPHDRAPTRRGGRARTGAESGEPDTRTRIQRVALELFTERGYEATSLREIAERLGVTKAALYYHFKSKDEIIDSVVADRIGQVSDLIAWARTQPRSASTRADFLRRYAALLQRQGQLDLIRFFERNQSSMTKHKAGVMMRGLVIDMLGLLTDADAPLTEQVRCSLAIFALHSAWFTIRSPQVSDADRVNAALTVALDLIDAAGGAAPAEVRPTRSGPAASPAE